MTSYRMASDQMASYQIGDKVDPLHSNHQEGTVIAILTSKEGEPRYAVEMADHHTIQLVTADRLSPYGGASD